MKAGFALGIAGLWLVGAATAAAAGSDSTPERTLGAFTDTATEKGAGGADARSTDERSTSSGVAGFFDRSGVAVEVGGGVIGFANQDARADIKTGGSYTARLVVGTKAPVGFELGYFGSAQDVDVLGLSEGANLLGNGIEGDVRYNILRGMWQPYVLVGVAWKHYDVTHASFNTSAVNGNDNVAEVPLAAGLTWAMHPNESGLLLDARAAYRFATGEDLLGGPNGGGPGLSTWDVTLRAGWAF